MVTSVGEFTTEGLDLVVGGGPIPLVVARHYAAFASAAAGTWGFYPGNGSPIGFNWVHRQHFVLRRFSATEVGVYYLHGKVIFFELVGGVWEMTPSPAGFVYMGTPYQMTAAGTKIEMMDPESRIVLTFEFVSVPDGGNAPVERIRDRNGNALTFPNDGHTTIYGYDTNDNLASVVDPVGGTTTMGYDDNDDPVSVTDPLGGVSTLQRDGLRRVISRTDPAGNTAAYVFDATRRLASYVDGAGQVWGYTYDAEGALTARTNPSGETTQFTRDVLGRATQVQDPLGHVTSYE